MICFRIMELESLFRKCATTVAIGIFQRPTLKQKINEDLQNVKFWKRGLKNCVIEVRERAVEELEKIYDLPEIIKNELQNTLELLSIEIMEYTKVYKELDCLHQNIIDDLFWNSNGSVNDFETCKNILKRDLDLDVKIRLACIYCLEEEVHNLLLYKDKYWTKQLEDILLEDASNPNNTLIRYWVERLRKKLSEKVICKISEKKALDYAMLQWNYIAAKYLFEKLTLHEEYHLIRDFCITPDMTVNVKQNFHDRLEFPKIRKNHLLFFMVKQCEIENLQKLWQKSPDLPKTILECFISFTYRNYFFLYDKVFLKQIKDEKYFCELLTEVSSNFLTDPKLYEKIYLTIWNDYCSKHKYVNLLLFYDKHQRLIKNLLYADKYDFVHLLINKHEDDSKPDFFCKYAKTIAMNLIPMGKENIVKAIAVKCLLSRGSVMQFRDEWNDSVPQLEEEFSKYEVNKGGIVPQMQKIIDHLFQSFGMSDRIK